jgi:hypothetical protein
VICERHEHRVAAHQIDPLEGLRLAGFIIAEILEDELRNAEREQPTYKDFLLRLLRPQYPPVSG